MNVHPPTRLATAPRAAIIFAIMNRWLALLLFLAASFTAAAIGGYATGTSVQTWYPQLAKPSWNPPPWVFAPVWTVLYTMMSVAAWRVWLRRAEPEAKGALALFGASLVLNTLWSLIFFGARSPGGAFVEVILFWACLVAVQARFWKLDRPAGLLWLPYLAWVSFASVLNGTVWWLNR